MDWSTPKYTIYDKKDDLTNDHRWQENLWNLCDSIEKVEEIHLDKKKGATVRTQASREKAKCMNVER